MKKAVFSSIAGAFALAFIVSPAEGSLLVNGDFQAGNTGFYSDYTYSPGNIMPASVYDVLADPSTAHSSAHSYYDHTLGTEYGLMMAINGTDQVGAPNVVWRQTVTVAPGSSYDFELWHSLWGPGTAGIQVFINDVPFSPDFQVGGDLGEWVFYSETWDSGAATEAVIEIINTTATYNQNDFSIDDIVFDGPVALTNSTWGGIKTAL